MEDYQHSSSQNAGAWNDWSGMSFTRIMGLSFFASLVQNQYLFDSARLLILGTLIETGRRLCQWLMERFNFQYCITAQFDEGDPAYEWIILLLTRENVWRRSRDFHVNAKNSMRKWDIQTGSEIDDNAEYVPTYETPQLFRWKGYWVEIKRNKERLTRPTGRHSVQVASIYLSIYTLDMSVLSALIQEARDCYKEISRPNVTVHMADMPSYGPGFVWSNVKQKSRRPLSSIILLDGVIDSLVQDAKEFIDTEGWYVEAGIPHRRGYLLYGPPGTGKTSTIYALAGELGLEIYTLSLSSGYVDDSFLQKAASAIPKHSILLIEDIDCAFPSREDNDEDEDDQIRNSQVNYGMVTPPYMNGVPGRKSAVTLSGLLNVIDGVGSEEGRLFFATTNYINRLDPALLRPGRIDRKIQYKLATQAQASSLFTRFFARTDGTRPKNTDKPDESDVPTLTALAEQFSTGIPQHEFSTAELQGYLLSCKTQPTQAALGVEAWVRQELAERKEKREQEQERKRKIREKKEEKEARQFEGTMAKFGGMAMSMYGPNADRRNGMVTGRVVTGGMVTGDPAITLDVPLTPQTPATPSPAYCDEDIKPTTINDPALPLSVPLDSL